MRMNRKMMGTVGSITAAAAASALLAGAAAHADDLDLQKLYTVKSVKIQEVREVAAGARTKIDLESPLRMRTLDDPAPAEGSGGGLGEIGAEVDAAQVILDKIINMGKEVWAIVEANRPVVNVSSDTANALPEGVRNWSEMQGWRAPISHTYRVTYENFYGMNVVDFQFRVLYTPGGNVGGKGQYLTNLTIVPADLSVFWGYKFNATATVPSVTNAGTTEDPIAGATLQLQWTIDTVLKHEQSTANFYVQGDGTFQDLGDGT